MQMKLNTTYELNLSVSSLTEYKEMLEEYKRKLPQVAENIAKQVSEVGLQVL